MYSDADTYVLHWGHFPLHMLMLSVFCPRAAHKVYCAIGANGSKMLAAICSRSAARVARLRVCSTCKSLSVSSKVSLNANVRLVLCPRL